MPPRDWRQRIEDITEAALRIRDYTSGMTFDSFSRDQKTVDAVIRNIILIGEAARHIPGDVQERYPNVPWTDMQAMRNLVAHQYFGVDLAIVWDTVHEDVPALVTNMQEILDREQR